MVNETFDRNKVAIETALGDLPDTYKKELAHRLYTAYVHPSASTTLRSNIELIAPIMWVSLPKDVRLEVIRRVDKAIADGNTEVTEQAFAFARMVDGARYLSSTARKYRIQPIVEKLAANFGTWVVENECVRQLESVAAYVPTELLPTYVSALTHTYVGHMGGSACYNRTDFYANGAALIIPKMFEAFDDNAASAFVSGIKSSHRLRDRITAPVKLARLRALANIVLEKVSDKFPDREFLELLADASKEKEFFELLNKS